MATNAIDPIDQEQDQLDAEPPRKEPPQTLDDFAREMFQSTPYGEQAGMPSLDWLRQNMKSKSDTIRYLGHTLGFDAKAIHKHTGFAYQHCYNVLHQVLKRGPNTPAYIDATQWQCSHHTAPILIDVIVRKGTKDPNQSRILYRVCSECAKGLIPGVTDETIAQKLPGGNKP